MPSINLAPSSLQIHQLDRLTIGTHNGILILVDKLDINYFIQIVALLFRQLKLFKSSLISAHVDFVHKHVLVTVDC